MSKPPEAEAPTTIPPTKDDLERVQRKLVAHQCLTRCAELTFRAIHNHEQGSMSALVGPTGVGKTTLLATLADKLKCEFPAAGISDVPVVSLEMKASEEGQFNWKDFYRRLLPLINAPLDCELSRNSGHPALPSYKRSKDDLRQLVENNLKLRKTRVMLLDEAHHVALGRPAPIMLQQLEVLKSFANNTKVHLVLCGPYELMSSIELNAQLARRITVVHFPRYTTSTGDRQDFYEALYSLVEDIRPWTVELDLASEIDYFYNGSLGLIGLLKPWLVRAARLSSAEKSWKITRDLLNETVMSYKLRNVIISEIKKGEEKLMETDQDRVKLATELGVPVAAKTEGKIIMVEARKTRPGERLPKRDLCNNGQPTSS